MVSLLARSGVLAISNALLAAPAFKLFFYGLLSLLVLSGLQFGRAVFESPAA